MKQEQQREENVTFDNCPKGCKGLTYTHDDRETKSCIVCRHEWNRFATHSKTPAQDQPVKTYNDIKDIVYETPPEMKPDAIMQARVKALQECKDIVAKKYLFHTWDEVHRDCFFRIEDRQYGRDDLFNEAAELYANQFKNKSK